MEVYYLAAQMQHIVHWFDPEPEAAFVLMERNILRPFDPYSSVLEPAKVEIPWGSHPSHIVTGPSACT